MDMPNVNPFLSPDFMAGSPVAIAKVKEGIKILNNPNNYRPSQMAGIQGNLYPSIQAIDDAFALALVEYKRSLDSATDKDMTLADDVQTLVTDKVLPGVPGVFRGFCLPFVGAFGSLCGIYHCSMNRLEWAGYVSLSEEKRLREGIDLVKIRVTILTNEIETESNDGYISHGKNDELRQISLIFKAITGNDLSITHRANQLTVDEFLQKFS